MKRSMRLVGEESILVSSGIHRVAVIEDHLLQRKFVVGLIESQHDMRVVFSGEELPQLAQWLATASPASRPDLVLLDLTVDRGPSAKPEAVRRLVESNIRVVLFSALTAPALARQLIREGVQGVIGKRDSEKRILDALRLALAGEYSVSPDLIALIAHDPARPRLSGQEERAMALYASGLSIESVATSIGVRPNTAKKYLQRVRDKYASVKRPLTSRLDWSRTAVEDGYLDLVG